MAVKVRCPKCNAIHVTPQRVDPDSPPETLENTCYAPHPSRGADFEGCGETVELEVIGVKNA